MIEVDTFSGETIAVMGLARSGLAAARALQAGGAEVRAWDDAPERREAAAEAGVALSDLNQCAWDGVRALVLSPGIPDSFPEPHPIAKAARAEGCEIISDIDLLARARPEATYIGITGTNGKSTTSALIGHILKGADVPVEVGGNIGVPVLDLATLGAGGAYVLELSSYQLERTPTLRPNIAVLLNISPDHLDRHGGLDGYVDAKRMIFDNPGTGGPVSAHAVVGMEDAHCRGIGMELMLRGDHKIIPISGSTRAAGGVYVEDGILFDDIEYRQASVGDLRPVTALPGRHNWQNAAAAYAVARLMGLAPEPIIAGIATFPGLPHRQELVGEIGQIAYVNDSKATNSLAAARALQCYDAVHWIAGGQFKEDTLAALDPHIGRVRGAYLIGEAALEFENLLGGRVPVRQCGDLETALAGAHAAAQAAAEAAVVLFSPACASFDQFDDFEARGDAFRRQVRELTEAPA
ncbi:MAG: UDP-N-acetylmuramoyl-L-alanine--D-glutamate ligase [Rhodospirillales bacterium]|nr:UDP-N-acetylmuramoyl-L-alanine--D-glutamate ligase [Rhodospirillaceae bacterium]MDP6428722.1 UDP-N-acetylmuramoyl-L-alanine--D-glutamate ligase [Rhodospirillales bacterium]MDP6643807.1 UDP-N-acetylmuramoyl-L-alanine--D-glutamate ligase [Rhodospirillales bacterium]MDP6841307.1 UDP-N-acetylmuramoyl-L-alanine--D-glutamate ligase [Rhodospirillales bacterium]